MTPPKIDLAGEFFATLNFNIEAKLLESHVQFCLFACFCFGSKLIEPCDFSGGCWFILELRWEKGGG